MADDPRALSAALRRCDGNEIRKPSRQRKNRFLVSMPGLLAPQGAGRIGMLADMHTAEPRIVFDLDDGRVLELRGRSVSSATHWMTLKLAGDALFCKDVFDRVLVFDRAEWLEKDAVKAEAFTAAAAADGAAEPAEPAAADDGDFELGLSVVARGQPAAANRKRKQPADGTTARKRPSYKEPDSEEEEEEDGGDSEEEEEEKEPSVPEDKDDGGAAGAPPAASPPRKRRRVGDDAAAPEVAASASRRAPRKRSVAVTNYAEDDDDDEESDGGGGGDDSDF
ncbi:hypothetical protein M885DRAFT_588468 [Pelagophyceae sp. CCMP2097]|nr:hypothetical protein M885DRAFT_588468 [Pelagophyceae sp. CCMP2097]